VNTPITATGDFKAGDSVQLTDPKGNMHTVISNPANNSIRIGVRSNTTT